MAKIQRNSNSSYSPLREGLRLPLELIDRHIEDVERLGPDTWLEIPTGRTLQVEDIIEQYGEFLPIQVPKVKKIPSWLSELRETCDVRLIEAQRLFSFADVRRSRRSPSFKLEPAVSSYSKELAAKIQEVQAQYGTYSQQLDS